MLLRCTLVAGLLLLGTGCEWILGSGDPHFSEAVPLTSPWIDLDPPLGDGLVTMSTSETLTVHHPSGTAAEHAASWGGALEADGWTLDADASAGDVVTQSWSRDGANLAFSSRRDADVIIVSLTLLPF